MYSSIQVLGNQIPRCKKKFKLENLSTYKLQKTQNWSPRLVILRPCDALAKQNYLNILELNWMEYSSHSKELCVKRY